MGFETSARNCEIFLSAVRKHAGTQGLEAVRSAFAGSVVYVPSYIKSGDHPLAKCLGLKVARAVCAETRIINADEQAYGLGRVSLPLGRNTKYQQITTGLDAVFRQKLDGSLKKSVQEIAIEFGIHERTVWRKFAEFREMRREQAERACRRANAAQASARG